jgi:gluconolactonase
MFCAARREVHHGDHGEHGEKQTILLLSVLSVCSVVKKKKRSHRGAEGKITKPHKTSHFAKTQNEATPLRDRANRWPAAKLSALRRAAARRHWSARVTFAMPQPLIPIDRFEIFASGLDHPECVAFDRAGYSWAGGEAGQVYRIDPTGKIVEQIAALGGFTGGIALSADDEIFVCNPKLGVVHVKRNGQHAILAESASGEKIVCPNFPLFDSRGHLWVTDSGVWKKTNGWLVRIDPRGKAERVAGPFGYANGLALTTDERTLFMVESNTDRLLRFSLGANGPTGEAEVFAENVGRLPDGVTLDAAGNLYVCCYASDELWKLSADGKQRQLLGWDHHAILIARPTNLAFGGEDFDWIYVANLGRDRITRAKLGVVGQKPVNLR